GVCEAVKNCVRGPRAENRAAGSLRGRRARGSPGAQTAPRPHLGVSASRESGAARTRRSALPRDDISEGGGARRTGARPCSFHGPSEARSLLYRAMLRLSSPERKPFEGTIGVR